MSIKKVDWIDFIPVFVVAAITVFVLVAAVCQRGSENKELTGFPSMDYGIYPDEVCE